MAVRAMWKGVLHAGEARIPVKLHAAYQDRGVHFRLLDAEEQVPVRQEWIDPDTEAPVNREEIRKGYPVEEGVYAVMQPEDFEAVVPPASRQIALSPFLPLGALNDRWFDRAYWLSPDGQSTAYFALVEALRSTGREALARWVMRKKRYHGSLRVHGEHLLLIRLRFAEQVISAEGLPLPTGRTPDPREVKLAHQLIHALIGPFDPDDFPETYPDRVRALVEAKADGKVIELPKVPESRAEGDLADTLRESLRAVGAGDG